MGLRAQTAVHGMFANSDKLEQTGKWKFNQTPQQKQLAQQLFAADKAKMGTAGMLPASSSSGPASFMTGSAGMANKRRSFL